MKLVERIAQEFKDVRNHSGLSSFASYHLIDGNLSVDNFVNTQGMNTTLYTGNGGVQPIVTGIDMATQWGDSVEETFGGLVWLKSRSVAGNNILNDTVRGANKVIVTDQTASEATYSPVTLSSFNSNGFSLSTYSGVNTSSATYTSWNFQTTHRVTGTTNHGKAYTCHYNPFTGFTMVKYEGSGIAGHKIPHHLGRKLGFYAAKSTTLAQNWISNLEYRGSIALNLSDAETTDIPSVFTDDNIVLNVNSNYNTNGAINILYGWANSYFDESNKLIGNYEVGIYQGTGVAGNKVTTKGKPAWVMIKRLDSTGNWRIIDNQRTSFTKDLYPNLPNAEGSTSFTIVSNGFVISNADAGYNASGGQYLYMVVYDTNSNGGGTYYPKATDNANVQINNAIIPLAKGIDSNGAKNEIVIANETITGVTLEEGKNYLYKTDSGYGKSVHRPRYLKSELIRTYAGEQPDYFDVEKNKWFSCDAGSELVINGKFDTNIVGWTPIATTNIAHINNALRVNTTNTQNVSSVSTQLNLVVGYRYKILGTVTSNLGIGSKVDILDASFNVIFTSRYSTYSDKKEYDFVATSSICTLSIDVDTRASTSTYGYIDNVSVFPVEITPTTEITESRNYMNHIVHADSQGNPLFVEELPKIKYENIIKADEFRGKNACTAWVNFDGSTTPITIRDSYNVSKVIRIGAGVFEIYFKEPMDNLNYSFSVSGAESTIREYYVRSTDYLKLNKIKVESSDIGFTQGINVNTYVVQIFGGKN